MPGKALAIMLIGHAILVGALALILSSMEGRMIDKWSRGQVPDSVPASISPGDR